MREGVWANWKRGNEWVNVCSGSQGMIIKSPGNGIRGWASSMCKGTVRVQDISLRHQCIWR